LRQDSVTKVMMVSDHRLKMTSTTLRKYHVRDGLSLDIILVSLCDP
jgi:hypothetical protein